MGALPYDVLTIISVFTPLVSDRVWVLPFLTVSSPSEHYYTR